MPMMKRLVGNACSWAMALMLAVPLAASCDASKSSPGEAVQPLEEGKPAQVQQGGDTFSAVPVQKISAYKPSDDEMGYDEKELRNRSPSGLTEDFYLCVRNNDGDKASIGTCMVQEIDRQDFMLNKIYGLLTYTLSENQKKALVEAQREWLKFHDKTEYFDQELLGDDPIASLQVTENKLFRLRDRVNVLEKYMDYVDK
jgi:uncharacterized protein YecT (DUF1311 family)